MLRAVSAGSRALRLSSVRSVSACAVRTLSSSHGGGQGGGGGMDAPALRPRAGELARAGGGEDEGAPVDIADALKAEIALEKARGSPRRLAWSCATHGRTVAHAAAARRRHCRVARRRGA